jgi:hypothetical protein
MRPVRSAAGLAVQLVLLAALTLPLAVSSSLSPPSAAENLQLRLLYAGDTAGNLVPCG